jgi:hypothetical protein
MFNKIIFSIILFLFPILANSQSNYGKVWGLGAHKQIVQFVENSKFYIQKIGNDSFTYFNINNGVASICDKNGNFLMMTDGILLYNSNGDTIKGGGGNINNDCYSKQFNFHNAYVQNSIIIPKIKNEYYIFYGTISNSKCNAFFPPTIYDTFDFDEIRYSVVDMDKNNGAGEITVLNKQLLSVPSPWVNKVGITATRHANGRDWWVVRPSSRQRQYKYIFLVTPDTIIEHTQDLGLYFGGFQSDNSGQIIFSQDGRFYAECTNNGPITIYDFDRCKGEFNIKRIIEPTAFKDKTYNNWVNWCGVCFSPNNQYLYICDDRFVYQINIYELNDSLATIKVSEKDTSKNFPKYSNMQLTPTGNIWIGSWNSISSEINAIMKPNEYGKACEFKFDYISLLSNTDDPPNIPNYSLGALAGSPCDTIRVPPNEWVLYPNPTTEEIKLKVPNSIEGEIVQVGIYDMLGKLVLMQERLVDIDHEVRIDVRRMADGMYVVKAVHQQSKFVTKFVKD